MTSKLHVDEAGTKRWRNEAGQLHRLDGPAIEHSNGDKWWYIDDKELTEQEFNDHPDVCMHRLILKEESR